MAVVLNLTAKTDEQRRILEYLTENASAALAEKINNGIKTTINTDSGDPVELIRRKDLDDCWSFIKAEAKKYLKNKSGGVLDTTVFGWAVHYFEEDEIEGGQLYNTDGSLYVSKSLEKSKKGKDKDKAKQEATAPATPKKSAAKPEKSEAKETRTAEPTMQAAKAAAKKSDTKSTPKQLSGQMSLFDFMSEEAEE